MMGSLAQYAIANGRFTVFVLVAIIFAGLGVYMSLPSQEDPEITIRVAGVTASFPGMSAERVEQLITKPIEEAVKEMEEVKEISSKSMTGFSIVTVSLHDRYFDLDPIWTTLRNKMADLKGSLPDGTSGPFVDDAQGVVASATFALTGADYSMAELRKIARFLRDRIGSLSLVSQVDLFGVQEERIWLQTQPEVLNQLGIAPANVIAALTGQNIILPGGTILADGIQIPIEPSGNFETVEQIRNVPLDIPDGGLIYLRDIFDITRGYVDPLKKPVLFDGKPAIVLAVSKSDGINISDFSTELLTAVEMWRHELPLGVSLDLSTYQPPFVEKSIEDATTNLLQTIATVLVVVILFLGLRTGVIVGSIVPLTILAVLIGMMVWSIPLHRISIAAIVIALGLLVDNAIVVAENIKRRLDSGADRLEACLAAPAELGMPLLTSSLTTIFAFLPLYLAENVVGEFVRSLSQVMILALLSSWFLSIAVTPALCYWFLKETPLAPGDTLKAVEARLYEGRLYTVYRRFLTLILSHKSIFVGCVLGVFALSIYGMGFVTSRLMPESDRAQVLVYIDMPAGTDVSETYRVSNNFSDWLMDEDLNPTVANQVIYVGDGGPRFFLALSPLDAFPHKAFALINLESFDDVAPMMARINEYFISEVPDAWARVEKLFLGPSSPGNVEIRVLGPSIQEIQRIGAKVEAIYRTVPGVEGLRSDWDNPVFKVKVEIDQDRARRAGVTSEEVANALSAYFDGLVATNYREGDTVIPVMVRADEGTRGALDMLRSITVFSAQRGVGVPIVQIADIGGEVEPYLIQRFDQERAMKISGRDPSLQASEFYALIQPQIDALELPFGYRMQLGGELASSGDANSALFQYLPHCLALIGIILVWQFNSYRRPLIVVLTIPLVLIGASAGLLLTGAFLDFIGMLGLLSLAGVIINNGIVLIDRVDEERKLGQGIDEAVIAAAMARARPIIMTTLTTILGLFPLMLFGGELWFSMTIVIIFGLAIGTVFTLGFVPVLYSSFFKSLPALLPKRFAKRLEA